MGKGDGKTRKGKIFKGSFGNSRPQKINKTVEPVAKASPVAAVAKPKRKSVPKKKTAAAAKK